MARSLVSNVSFQDLAVLSGPVTPLFMVLGKGNNLILALTLTLTLTITLTMFFSVVMVPSP